MRIIGLDLSLSSTGVAIYDTDDTRRAWVHRIDGAKWAKLPGAFRRLRNIRGAVMDYAAAADLVVIESLAISRQTGQHLTRAGLWHLVMEPIDAMTVPWCEIGPTALKRYATGKGNASKDEVLAAVIRRYPDVPVMGNDEADALVLVAMAAHHYQVSTLPPVPQTHATALAKVAWPDLGRSVSYG